MRLPLILSLVLMMACGQQVEIFDTQPKEIPAPVVETMFHPIRDGHRIEAIQGIPMQHMRLVGYTYEGDIARETWVHADDVSEFVVNKLKFHNAPPPHSNELLKRITSMTISEPHFEDYHWWGMAERQSEKPRSIEVMRMKVTCTWYDGSDAWDCPPLGE